MIVLLPSYVKPDFNFITLIVSHEDWIASSGDEIKQTSQIKN